MIKLNIRVQSSLLEIQNPTKFITLDIPDNCNDILLILEKDALAARVRGETTFDDKGHEVIDFNIVKLAGVKSGTKLATIDV